METKTENETRTSDKYIVCVSCGDEFIWTAEEQRFYSDKLLSAPRHCQPCRDERRRSLEDRRHQAKGAGAW